MRSTDLRPLPSWAEAAKTTFFASWTLVPIMVLLDDYGAIDSDANPWHAVRVIVAVVWSLAGVTWALSEYRRRR